MNRKISLAHLTAIDLPPPALIEAAARAGFDGVGLRLIRVTAETPGYPLMSEPAMMRETLAAIRDTGVGVPDIEFVRVTPEFDAAALAPFLDAGAELGARHVIAAPYDDDHARLAGNLAALAELAGARGIGVALEFFPWTSVPDLSACWRVAREAGEGVGVLVDCLHFDRSGSDLDALAGLPPERLPFAHLCDALVAPPYALEDLLSTAREARLPPGEGEIDLGAIIAALPPETPLGVEVPMRGAVEGASLDERLKRLRAAADAVLKGLG